MQHVPGSSPHPDDVSPGARPEDQTAPSGLENPPTASQPPGSDAANAPSRRRTKDEQRALQTQVVGAALRLFDEGGYEAVSMRKVAAAVGVPPMTLYRYFPSKAHLIRHLWDDLLAKATAVSNEAAGEAGDGSARLRRFMEAFIDHWAGQEAHYRVVFAVDDRDAARPGDPVTTPRPDPQPVVAAIEAIASPEAADAGFGEWVLCQALGYLNLVLGTMPSAQRDPQRLKQRVLDGIEAGLGRAR